MPGEDDRQRDYFGERPPPTVDPTKLTTEAVARAEIYLKELFSARLDGVKDLYSEKLRGLTTQITERDTIRDQAKIDANERIAAALQAQKEAVGKTETSFGEQIKSLQTTMNALADSLRREISDLKDRQNVTEGQRNGFQEQRTISNTTLGFLITGVGVMVIVVQFLFHVSGH